MDKPPPPLKGFHLHKDLVSTPNQNSVATTLNTCNNIQ